MSDTPYEHRDPIMGGIVIGNDKIAMAGDFCALLRVKIAEKEAGQTWENAVSLELEHWQDAKLAKIDLDEVEDFYRRHYEGELPLTTAEIFEQDIRPELELYEDWDAMQTSLIFHSEEGHDPSQAIEVIFRDSQGTVLERHYLSDVALAESIADIS
ncbi:hypothetical protein KJ359_010176 [Pestalotiopsis sp. 9143b]|nr:hypothetical protein KJ359_010176 [Pestalotiopsis sp. 9143b]